MHLSKLLLSLVLLVGKNCSSQTHASQIKLNQVGFYLKGPKCAIVTTPEPATRFYLLSLPERDTVWAGKLGAEKQSANSATRTRIADFGNFRKKGIYVVSVPGVGTSYPFQIASKINHSLAVSSLKSYYYQRVSIPLVEKYAGKWKRAAGHPDTAVLIHSSAATPERTAGTGIPSPGGWYDAGDYNKYIVNSGITMGTLLSAYEDFKNHFDTLKTNIPESGNKAPDILDEILYNLRWMLTMQDQDGGVYHKCTNVSFDGMVMPGVTKAPRYAVQKGTAATLDFAAVTAQSSRVFKRLEKQFPGLSDSCLAASKKAWRWALKNPHVEYDQEAMNTRYEPKVTTGAYGDRNFADEWFWAAAELYTTTKEKTYYVEVSKGVNQHANVPAWGEVQMLGFYTLLRFQRDPDQMRKKELKLLKEKVVNLADRLISGATTNAFGTAMGQSRKDFVWGSNSVAANQGIVLINAYLITNNKKYVDHAISNLDYILGRNATGYCFVTGIGTKSTMNPHHRPSIADGIEEPIPGFLAGGPNPGMQDAKDSCSYVYKEPETAYVDANCSYASNEIAINWNAPLVYIVNAMESLQKEAGY